MPYPNGADPKEWAECIGFALDCGIQNHHHRDFLLSVKGQCEGKGKGGRVVNPFISPKQITWVKKRINENLGTFEANYAPGAVHVDGNTTDDGVICPFDQIVEE